MKAEVFFALLTVRILNLRFIADQESNPNIIGFRNNRGNSVYLTLGEYDVDINVFKNTNSCYRTQISSFDLNEDKIEELAETIKSKLDLIRDNKKQKHGSN